MAKKLVLDRVVNISTTNDSSFTVPSDEVWRVTLAVPASSSSDQINGSRDINNAILGGGAKMANSTLTGVAFKLVEV